MKDLCADSQGLAKSLAANRHNHEFLKIHIVVRMCASVDDVHHGNGESASIGPAEILVERKFEISSSRARSRQRNGEQGICSELRFCRCAIQIDQGLVDLSLIESVHTL